MAQSLPIESEWANNKASWPPRRRWFASPSLDTQLHICGSQPTHQALKQLWEAGMTGTVSYAAPLIGEMLVTFQLARRDGNKLVLSLSGQRVWKEWHQVRDLPLGQFGSSVATAVEHKTRRRSQVTTIDVQPPQPSAADDVARRLNENRFLVETLHYVHTDRSPGSWLHRCLYSGTQQQRRDTTVALLQLQALGLLDKQFELTQSGIISVNMTSLN